MLLTIATTHSPARDLGFLLHKHPDRMHAFTEPMGTAHVFYPEASGDRCTVALLLEVDPVGLVRGRKGPAGEGFALTQYVNDRPYAASSMLAMALKDVFRTAMTGRCDARPELAATAIPLEIHVPAVASRAGADLPRRLFEPLGWRVAVATSPLDPAIPAWGESPYLDVRLSGTVRLADALNHLYVLLPVLDDAKHYRVGGDEVDKLLRAGADWLASHPESELIARRYLSHRRELTRSALARLAEVDDTEPEQLDDALGGAVDLDPPDRPLSLAEQRRGAVVAVLRSHAARRVGDLGCGEGLLARDLLGERTIEHVLAADVSARALRIAGERLRVERMSDSQRARLTLIQSSLTYRDERLTGLDAVVLMEVVEHVDLSRLGALEATVFGYAAPRLVLVTTPNAEHNVRFATLPAGAMRHRDHRFEWSRAQLRAWAARVAAEHGYTVRHLPIGPDDSDVGPPTQLAVFSRAVAA